MKFNEGDEVFIRKHTDEEKQTYLCGWLPRMNKFENKIGTILCRVLYEDEPCYHIQQGHLKSCFMESSLSTIVYEQF